MADSTNIAAASLTFSVLSFILLLVTLVFFLFPDFSKTIRAGINISGDSAGGIGSSFKMLGAFLGALSPDITLLSGFVSDVINGSFRYSVTSIIGVLAVVLHWGVAGLIHGFGSGAAPSAVSAAASVLASAAASSASTAQILGVGGEPTNPTPPAGTGPSTTMQALLRPAQVSGINIPQIKRSGPKSVGMSTISENVGAKPSGKASVKGALSSFPVRQQRSAAATSQANTQKLVANKLVGGGESEEEMQTGGAWEIPEDLRSSFNPCSIRGLGMFDISKSPMGMAALSSVFAVYLLDMTVNGKRSSKDVTVYLIFSSIVYGLNLFSYSQFKCYGSTFGEVAKSTILPIVLGFAAGSAGFSVLKTTFPAYLPLDQQRVDGPGASSKHATCAPPNDKDQFVCDAYKDGKRITSTVIDD